MFLRWCATLLDFTFELFFLGSPKGKALSKKMELGANCHLCNRWVADAHPKGEFVVCDPCQQAKPG